MVSRLAVSLLHPILFAIFPIFFIFVNNVDIIPVSDVILPLTVVILATVILLAILKTVLKSWNKASLVISLGLVLFFSYGHFYNIINKSFSEFILGHHRYLLIPFIVVFIVGTVYFVKTTRKLDNANTITSAMSIVIVAMLAMNFVFAFQPDQSSFTKIGSPETVEISKSVRPDIYYIILDAYGDAHTLKRIFDYDNSDFINYLESRGFKSPNPSFSNYPNTYLSLSSSLNMEYIPYLLDVESASFDVKLANDIINNNKVMQTAKKNGYKIISFDSGWGPTRKMAVADLNLCGKNSFLDSEFLISVVDTSMLKPFYVKFFESNNRDRFECIFSQLPEVGKIIDEPVFVFAHMLLPHPPYIFGPNGEALTPKSLTLISESDKDENEDYLNQLKFTNKKMQEIVDKILDNSESPPIIIIQSDHGPPDSIFRSVNDVMSDKDKLRNINFYYLPDSHGDLVYDGITPVNSFRLILKSYLGEDLPQLENRNYYINEYENMYKLIDVTEELSRK